jgi:hypothetical protein
MDYIPSRPNRTSVSILPLPGLSCYIQGYYGLEECLARGVIRIHGPQIAVKELRIRLLGIITAKFMDYASTISDDGGGSKNIVDEIQVMLTKTTLFELSNHK